MKMIARWRAVVVALAVFSGVSAVAAPLYWDGNGTAAGAGPTPDGTWGVDAYWNSVAAGTGTPGAWADNNEAVFSAGADAVAATVTVSGARTVSALTLEEGAYTFAGTSSPSLRIASNGSFTVAAAAAGSQLGASLPMTLLGGSESWTINGDVALFGPVASSAGTNTQVRKYGSATLTVANSFSNGASTQFDHYAGNVEIAAGGSLNAGTVRLYGGSILLGTDSAFGPSTTVSLASSASRIKSADATPRTVNRPVTLANGISPTFEGAALTFGDDPGRPGHLHPRAHLAGAARAGPPGADAAAAVVWQAASTSVDFDQPPSTSID